MVALATALFFMKSWFFSVLIENHLEFCSYCWFYGKPSHLGISVFDFCKFECGVPMSVWQSYPKPIFPKNTSSYAHKSYFETEEKGFSRPEFLTKSWKSDYPILTCSDYPTIGISDSSKNRIIRFGGLSPNRTGVGVKGSFEHLSPPPTPSLHHHRPLLSRLLPSISGRPNSCIWPDLVLLLPGNTFTEDFSSMDEGNFFSLIS